MKDYPLPSVAETQSPLYIQASEQSGSKGNQETQMHQESFHDKLISHLSSSRGFCDRNIKWTARWSLIGRLVIQGWRHLEKECALLWGSMGKQRGNSKPLNRHHWSEKPKKLLCGEERNGFHLLVEAASCVHPCSDVHTALFRGMGS